MGDPQTPRGEPGGVGSAGDGDQGIWTHQGEQAGLGRARSGVAVRLLEVCHALPTDGTDCSHLTRVDFFCVYLSAFAMVSRDAKIFGENGTWMCFNNVLRGQYLCVYGPIVGKEKTI